MRPDVYRGALLLVAILALGGIPSALAEREIFTMDCAGQIHFAPYT